MTLPASEFAKLKYANEKFQELKDQFMEMGQLKSDFDMEKFTVRHEGGYIAHCFHFLMRQYSLALYELRRMINEREHNLRRLKELQGIQSKGTQKIKVKRENVEEDRWVDLEINSLLNTIDLGEVTMMNKLRMCEHFERLRLKLIEENGGTAPTNEQYQQEEPEYLKWLLSKKAVFQSRQRQTGISEGIWENIHYLEESPVLNPDFQVPMLDGIASLDLAKAAVLIEEAKSGFEDRGKNIEEINKRMLAQGG